MTVVVGGGIIRAIHRCIARQWRQLPVIDAIGATLLPGFIDAHTHTHTVTPLQDALRFGVTTVLDMEHSCLRRFDSAGSSRRRVFRSGRDYSAPAVLLRS